jgi:hypothetical protein
MRGRVKEHIDTTPAAEVVANVEQIVGETE